MAPVVADVTITTTVNGKETLLPGRYYRSGTGKIREDRGGISVITDLVGGTITVLNHERREKQVRLITRPSRPTDDLKRSDPSGLPEKVSVSEPLQSDKLEAMWFGK